MTPCPHCGASLAPDAQFCSRCGRRPSSVSQMETSPATGGAASPPLSPPPSSADVRFAPGTVLAERYRIVAALGRGGMGEVYRADDLKLGHPVALKFLPRALAEDPHLLDRFHAEVRNSRQVSHPNVCRVYDIGEFQGLTFLTMEYIDGEDLASLLRRIGRLPPDKALEIAHQLCAGLAAAHDAGLLHRDLKPANIMLDGRGRSRITDFGLAVAADDVGGRQQFAGTPAYMAPEQRAGALAGIKTDIYSLGLVLFEIFTGKRAFEDSNLAAWKGEESGGAARPARPGTAEQRSPAPGSLSSTSADVDPAVKRAILRCLETDPALRPASAMQVAAALPGGDPLAAALAAGETPSPEMVAAAGEEIAISVRAATILLLAIFAMLALLVPLSRRGTFLGLVPSVKPPEVLEARAQDIAKQAGYTGAVADTYRYFSAHLSYVQWRAHSEPRNWYRNLDSAVPDPYRFTYRTSPEPLLAFDPFANPGESDPPMSVSGMTTTILDGSGRLLSFRAVPPFKDKDLPSPAPPDWPAFFAAAGWSIADFKPSTPQQIPNTPFDARAAWEGTVSGTPLRLEAASLRGRPVAFSVTGPWFSQTPVGGSSTFSQVFFWITILVVLPVFGGLLARRNLRLGRGDPAGATRLSAVVIAVIAINTLLAQHWVAHPGILNNVTANTGLALLLAVVVWVSYVALEPLLRRQAPHLLISWTRLLSGRMTDGMVGRDVLIGAAAGILVGIVHMTAIVLPWWFPVPSYVPYPGIAALNDTGHFIGSIISQIWVATLFPLTLGFCYGILRIRLRRPWIAAILLYAFVWPMSFNSEGLLLQLTVGAIGSALFVFVFLRFGLLALAAEIFVENLLFFYPPVLRSDAWYFAKPLIVLLLVVAIVIYAFRCSLAGRPLLPRLLDEA